MATRTIHTLAELHTFAEEFASTLPAAESAVVVTLSGELGAGKTAFTQALASVLGVREAVVSPTFMIMRRYKTTHPTLTTLVHIDAYRVEDPRELAVLHIPELFSEKGTLVCIEWPERMSDLLPPDTRALSFAIGDGETRTVTFER